VTRVPELVDPVVVGIAGGHGGAPPCALPVGAAPVALPAVVDLFALDGALAPPADAPDALGSVDVGTLRGSQPSAMEQVGFAGLVGKLVAPPLFCCAAWAAGAAAAAGAGFCVV
jgi:hypothetical protein